MPYVNHIICSTEVITENKAIVDEIFVGGKVYRDIKPGFCSDKVKDILCFYIANNSTAKPRVN